jgi:lambda repressor-like predicted transcriptional regulator
VSAYMTTRRAEALEESRRLRHPRRRAPRFDFAALEPIIIAAWRPTCEGESTAGLSAKTAALTGLHRSMVSRYRRNGIPVLQADRIAVALGRHPGEIWPEWWAA